MKSCTTSTLSPPSSLWESSPYSPSDAASCSGGASIGRGWRGFTRDGRIAVNTRLGISMLLLDVRASSRTSCYFLDPNIVIMIYPVDPEKMQHNRPVIILESPDGTSNAPTHSWPRRQSNLQRKPVPSVGSAGGRSNPGSNPGSPPLSPQGTRNKELQYASPYGDHQLKNLPPTPAPASSHPFQTYSQTQSLAPGPPPPGSQMMSVQHINTTAPSSNPNRGFWNRMRQSSAMSAGKAESESDSATQLGSGDEGTRPVPVPPPGSGYGSGRGPAAGSGYGTTGRGRGTPAPAPAPVHLSPHAHAQLYDPHEGNTLSYVSSDSDGAAPMSMPAAVPMVPADSFYGAPSAQAQAQAQAEGGGGAPPGYRGPYGSAGEGRGSGYPQEKESRTGGSARGHW